ncbi:P2 family phage major capsid protein [Avibacterium paragallinarum]|uniref:P2 family phage major capsid protein n=1 Tax=Avibacterium paragallinarum TaxID=728 RepID=UPI00397D4D20
MENLTAKNYNNYIQHLSTMLKVNIDGALAVFDLDGKIERDFFKSLETSPFLGLINIIKTTEHKGETLGISVPMPSQTDINQHDRTPEKGHISPPQKFHCEQIDLDTSISYPKLDRIAGVLEVDFSRKFEEHLTTEILLSLLLVGWNGKNRLQTSNPVINKLAEDVKKGWLQKIRENAVDKLISVANVGADQEYKSLNSLVKAGLAKIGDPIKGGGDMIAICGRNVLSDFPIDAALSTPRMTVSQKLIGGLKAVGVDYFPADSILITRLDNLSLYVQKGTIRRIMERNPAKDRLDIYNSLVVDFVIEDYNAVALIENINIID